MCDEKEEIDMAVQSLVDQYVINEEAAEKIISASPIILPESNEFNDLYVDDKERKAHASNILRRRKCK